jgi:hypothetical protein
VAAACNAWNRLLAEAGRITALCFCPWIPQVNTPGHGEHLGLKEHRQQVSRANVTLYNYGLDFLANAHAGE